MARASVWDACRTAVAERLRLLDLPQPGQDAGTTPIPIHERFVPHVQVKQFPFIVVTIEDLEETIRPIATGVVEAVYPVNVWVCQRDPGASADKVADYLGWRSEIIDAFRTRVALDGVPSVVETRVRPLRAFDGDLPENTVIESGVVVECVSTEPLVGVPG